MGMKRGKVSRREASEAVSCPNINLPQGQITSDTICVCDVSPPVLALPRAGGWPAAGLDTQRPGQGKETLLEPQHRRMETPALGSLAALWARGRSPCGGVSGDMPDTGPPQGHQGPCVL